MVEFACTSYRGFGWFASFQFWEGVSVRKGPRAPELPGVNPRGWGVRGEPRGPGGAPEVIEKAGGLTRGVEEKFVNLT